VKKWFPHPPQKALIHRRGAPLPRYRNVIPANLPWISPVGTGVPAGPIRGFTVSGFIAN
jgi:hypothetical protein